MFMVCSRDIFWRLYGSRERPGVRTISELRVAGIGINHILLGQKKLFFWDYFGLSIYRCKSLKTSRSSTCAARVASSPRMVLPRQAPRSSSFPGIYRSRLTSEQTMFVQCLISTFTGNRSTAELQLCASSAEQRKGCPSCSHINHHLQTLSPKQRGIFCSAPAHPICSHLAQDVVRLFLRHVVLLLKQISLDLRFLQ